MEELEGIPYNLLELMDELTDDTFLKIASCRLSKINAASDGEMEYIDYIMFKAVDIAKKTRFMKLSAENKMKAIQMVISDGLDPSIFFTESMKEERSESPPEEISKPLVSHSSLFESEPESSPPSLFQQVVDPLEMLPALNATKSSEKLRISFQKESKSFNNRQSGFENVFESYETETFENEVDDEPPSIHYKPNAATSQRKYRDVSRSPPKAYKLRSKSRGRSRSRSESPPSGSRSKSRGRYRARSRSKSRARSRSKSRARSRSKSRSRYQENRSHYGERDYYY